MKKAIVGEMCDGWQIILDDGTKFSWDHQDEDYSGLVKLLEHLGYNVDVEAWY